MGANWKFHRHYLFIDLEATCALDSGIARAERETIEIGAVAIDAASGEAIGSFQEYIRPVQHPKLTAFCTELTGITQAMVDGAPAFAELESDIALRLKDSVVIGHNVRFDLGFIKAEFDRTHRAGRPAPAAPTPAASPAPTVAPGAIPAPAF